LAGASPSALDVPLQKTTAAPAVVLPVPAPGSDQRIGKVRRHLLRYRELVSQGKWSDAGKELEAIEGLVK
jgi:hypothetical protein